MIKKEYELLKNHKDREESINRDILTPKRHQSGEVRNDQSVSTFEKKSSSLAKRNSNPDVTPIKDELHEDSPVAPMVVKLQSSPKG